MIELVKYQNRNGGKVLLADNGFLNIQECGLMIRFPSDDNRKPHHAVLLDNEEIRRLVDKLLVHLAKQ